MIEPSSETLDERSFVIRVATAEDAPLLPRIERDASEAFRGIPILAWLAEQPSRPPETYLPLIQLRTVWVAQKADSIVGFLAARVEETELHILEVDVASAFQRCGIGRRLLEAGANHARQSRLSAVTLTTFRDVPWNEPFYMRHGFRTLQACALGNRLRRALASEVEQGFPEDRRCAMRLDLPRGRGTPSHRNCGAR